VSNCRVEKDNKGRGDRSGTTRAMRQLLGRGCSDRTDRTSKDNNTVRTQGKAGREEGRKQCK